MHTSAQHIPSFIKSLEPFIKHYGYFGIGGLILLEDFGVLVPGETILIASAFYAGLGQLNVLLVALIGFIGAVTGDNIGFTIGKYGGHPLVEKLGKYIFLTPERINKAETFFNRHGGKVVTIARFIDGLRQANGIIAGLSEMKWLSFITFNAIGAALWVCAWTAVGYFGGSHIQAFLHYELYFTLVVIGLGIVFVSYRLFRRHQKKS